MQKTQPPASVSCERISMIRMIAIFQLFGCAKMRSDHDAEVVIRLTLFCGRLPRTPNEKPFGREEVWSGGSSTIRRCGLLRYTRIIRISWDYAICESCAEPDHARKPRSLVKRREWVISATKNRHICSGYKNGGRIEG